LDAFHFRKVLHYSARENRGRAALEEALIDAVRWLQRRQSDVERIGAGRAAVIARLEERRKAGSRFITQAEFLALCREADQEAGRISSPRRLLDYLHRAGEAFHSVSLFNEAIILDLDWTLDAVYAVFHYGDCYQTIKFNRGRFCRSDLDERAWRGHDVAKQQLFLNFMLQCGVCFVARKGDGGKMIEDEYIAPEFLPRRNDSELMLQLRQKWDEGCDAEATLIYERLPPAMMGSLISKIGAEAGLAAEYWDEGFCFYDEITGSKALVERRWNGTLAGSDIHVQTQRGQARALLERILEFIRECGAALGVQPERCDGAACVNGDEPGKGEGAAPKLKPAHESRSRPGYYISYAWGEAAAEDRKREAVIDKLCAEAEARGVEIVSARGATGYGDRIAKFLASTSAAGIGRGDRIVIVLTDPYLKSVRCMTELFETWRSRQEDAAGFIARTRVFALPCARIGTPAERAQYVIYWNKTFKAFKETRSLVEKRGQFVLSDRDAADYRQMRRFVKVIADILALAQDALTSRSFDDLARHGFDGPLKPGFHEARRRIE
jgi:internalin A